MQWPGEVILIWRERLITETKEMKMKDKQAIAICNFVAFSLK